ncbi:MAG: serine/threonine protein phosphatase, partial [Microcoleus sp.]
EKTVESVASPVKSLETGSFIEIKSSGAGELGKEGDHLDLRVAIGELTVKGTVPAGTVLQVTNKQLTPQGNWLELKVCSTPEIVRSNSPKPESNKDFSTVSKPTLNPSPAVATPSPSPAVKPTVEVESAKLQAGEIGWIQEQAAVSKVVSNLALNPTQKGKCVDAGSTPNTN